MDRTQKVIVALLIVAILFSAVSIAINLSVGSDFKPVTNRLSNNQDVPEGNPSGNLNLVIQSPEEGQE